MNLGVTVQVLFSAKLLFTAWEETGEGFRGGLGPIVWDGTYRRFVDRGGLLGGKGSTGCADRPLARLHGQTQCDKMCCDVIS